MINDCSIEVINVTTQVSKHPDNSAQTSHVLYGQVNTLWEQTVHLHNQISSIPNLTDNATEAASLYSAVSAFNATVFVTLIQLESVSVQANNVLLNLTKIVAINAGSYANEINESLQLLQNANESQDSAAEIERVASAHQGKLNNLTAQLEALLMNVSGLESQVQQLDMGVDMLQQLAIAIQDQRLSSMSLFVSATNNYTRASNALQLAMQEFTIAVDLEQNITARLQVQSCSSIIAALLWFT